MWMMSCQSERANRDSMSISMSVITSAAAAKAQHDGLEHVASEIERGRKERVGGAGGDALR